MLEPDASTVLWLAFGLAALFGVIAQKTHFCIMGAVADVVHMEDWSRMRMWGLAAGVAILGAGGLQAAGLIDLDKSIYRAGQLFWLSHLLGGFLFGLGMVLASGCGAKTLLRLGGGNLKSLVVFLVVGLVAYMTMRGFLATFRVGVLEQAVIRLPGGQDLPALLTAAGLAPGLAFWLAVLGVGGGLVVLALSAREFFTLDHLLGGLGVGALIVAGWYVSGHVGYVAEHPDTLSEAFLSTNSGRMESFTFVAPVAYTLDLLMLWSDSSRHPTFAVAIVTGVIAGAAAWSLLTGSFRWEGFVSVEDTVTHLLGAALMGFGGVTAMGCTIGQGVSGVSTLAAGAFLTVAGIVAGGVAMLRIQYWRLMRDA